MSKRKILIFYDWFYPGFKAGGPIQSLTHLAAALTNRFEVYVITSAYDLNSTVSYSTVDIGAWNDVSLPGMDVPIKIFYAEKRSLNKKTFSEIIEEILPETIYLNGIFSYRFFLLPLLFFSRIKSVKIVVCPRGMLKEGALSSKALKKKIYIKYLKLSNALNNVYWHATSKKESDEITRHFRANKAIFIAPNIPKKPRANISLIPKQPGKLQLVYLSLINEHKNLLLLLQLIKELEADISLHIYGPVINESYWKECEVLLKQIANKVEYKGAAEPAQVQNLIAQHHSLILLTKGENFGHAIYESLSVGRPVITSYFTPWQNLYENKAGENVDLTNTSDCKEKIMHFVKMSQQEFDLFCKGAHCLSGNYYQNLYAQEAYDQLFL